MICPVPPDKGQPVGQREASQPGDFLHSREREVAWRAGPPARRGGGRQEQRQPGHLAAGGAGEAEEGAEFHAAGEEDHRRLGAILQERNGESKTGIHIRPFTCSCPGPPPPCALCICGSITCPSICLLHYRICVFVSFTVLGCRSEMFP